METTTPPPKNRMAMPYNHVPDTYDRIEKMCFQTKRVFSACYGE